MSGQSRKVRAARLFCHALSAAAILYGLTFTATPSRSFAAAKFNTIQILHTFEGRSDGEYPQAGMILAGKQLFGTTFGSLGGTPGKQCSKGGCGGDFSLDQYAPSHSCRSRLCPGYMFKGGTDGAFPAAELTFNKSTANPLLYGTTEFGGGTTCNGLGCGTVFALTPDGSESAIFDFCLGEKFPNCAGGAFPRAALIIGSDGNLYGTATLGGTGNGYECDSNFAGCGTVYKLSPDLSTLSVLYSFCRNDESCGDGAIPFGKLVQDPSTGNFYGTTQFGGANGQGTIFELQPTKEGSFYAESVLYSFCSQTGCADGAVPEAGLVEDANGNFYGTASAGGGGPCQGSSPGCGVIFELAANGTYSVLHPFAGGTSGDGALPQATLTLDPSTNILYGTTEKGGDGPHCFSPALGCGTVFMATNEGTESIIYAFGYRPKQTDGKQPEGTLLLQKGYLYGATRIAGDVQGCNCGTLFKLSIGESKHAKRAQPSISAPGSAVRN